MDLGFAGLIDKIEDRLGRKPVTVLLILLYVLVMSWVIQSIVHAWVAVSGLIESGGRIGTAVMFASGVLSLVAWWLCTRAITERALRDFRDKLRKLDKE